MKNIITRTDLQQFFPADFEEYRAGGHEMRRELIHAVMRDLSVPDGWAVNGEYASEFGGFFPVQCRFTPSHEKFHLALCSPGDINPVWVLMFINATGTPAAVIRTELTFQPEVISHIVSLTALLDEQNYSAEDIVATLAREGGL